MLRVNAKAIEEGGRTRAVAYARVSTDLEEQMGSFENQVEMYTAKIMENPEWEFVKVYSDPAISGTTDERPGFKDMLDDARKGKFDLILCKSISRFARNTQLVINTISELKELGVGIIFEKEGIDTSKAYSEMLLTILSAFAQEESRNTSERIKKANQMMAANGKVAWTPLYGYYRKGEKGEKGYDINEDEAKVVRRVFSEYEHGASFRQIVAGLNKEGIPSPGGRKWNFNSVKLMLDNDKYMGDVITNKYFTKSHLDHKLFRNRGQVKQVHIENHHKGIIEMEQFVRVQKIKEMRAAATYPFEGMLTCPVCGEPLAYEADFLGPKRPVWKCEEDEQYFLPKKVADALLEAYRNLDAEMLEGKARAMKEAHPEFDSVDYWWLDDLVGNITLGLHTGEDDQTLTVEWQSGGKTTVPTRMGLMDRLRHQRRILERRRRTVRGERTVRKIQKNIEG